MKLTGRHLMLTAVVVLAAMIVLATRFAGGGDTTSGAITAPPTVAAPSSATAPSPAGSTAAGSAQASPSATGEEDPGHGDDGVSSDPPILVTPTNQPDVRQAATAFAAAWLNTTGRTTEVWLAALEPRITADLAADLVGADPRSVPVGAKVGSPVKVVAEGSLFNAAVPIIEVGTQNKLVGTLLLTVVRSGSTWLVSEIDIDWAGR